MAGQRQRGEWLRLARICKPLYEQLRNPKSDPIPYQEADFYPWPHELPKPQKMKPSEVF